MRYTDKQQRAINTCESTVLVSAAAGSGKTSVLTRRVAQLVEQGTDIRNMLVVTFTNAAAAEMRRRIARELYDAGSMSGDKRLVEQSEWTAAADISTFHSFCANVVREHYDVAQVSPDFKIMGDVETGTLKNRTIRVLFDLLYEQQDEDFLRLLGRYTARANDVQLAASILNVYDRMMGQAVPYEWAERAANMNVNFYIARLRHEYESTMLEKLEDAAALIDICCEITRECSPRQHAADVDIAAQLRGMAEHAKKQGIEAARNDFADFKIPNLLPKLEPEVKERTADWRKEARKHVKNFLQDETYDHFEETAKEELTHTQPDVRALVKLIRKFDSMYATAKQRDNLLDYEDLQHKALAVLRECAEDYSSRFAHIFVDEYQDTNPVQEEIINVLHHTRNNLFMVGDIKQSIYKFRLADPGIFREKAEVFKRKDAGELVVMNDNFRSMSRVIDAVNFVMDCVMSERLGEIEYMDDEKLIGNEKGGEAKILLSDLTGASEGVDHVIAQAEMIARHIEDVLQRGIHDRSGGQVRPARPGDIAVLMRSRSELTGEIKRALHKKGIPCMLSMKETRDIPELELFVNLLRIIQNPMQDVPLLSVMRSYIGQMDEQDFVSIRLGQQNETDGFYTAALHYISYVDDATSRKLRAFFDMLDDLRIRGGADALARFIPWLVEMLDFETFLLSRPDGNAKVQAMEELLVLTEELIAANGNSLYLLLRELADIKRREGGYVQVSGSADADSVKLMTIHGSKGLEFPVVYIAGLNKKFNTSDLRENFLMHGAYGVSAAYIDEKKLEKRDTVERIVWKEKIASENRSEELRMLYVAMTRAREKLYLTGYVKDTSKEKEKWRALSGRYDKAICMLDWIMAANEGEGGLPVEYFARREGREETGKFDYQEFKKGAMAHPPSELIEIPPGTAVPAKVSVSAVKLSQKQDVKSYLQPQTENDEITGAHLGTLVHGVMERIIKNGGEFEKTADELLKNEIITKEEYDALYANRGMVEGFLRSELYERMRNAEKLLFEQQFNMRMDAKEIGYDASETMLVQGILDAAFLEEGEWVLLDYKTDRVDEHSAGQATENYRIQIDLYDRALREITGTNVKQRFLYFLRPGIQQEL